MEWEKLLDAVRQMAETRTLDPLLTYATEQALHIIGADRSFLIPLNPDGSLDFHVQFSRSGRVLDHPEAEVSLTIVQRIVTRLSGEVGVESTPEARTVFSFTLPASTD